MPEKSRSSAEWRVRSVERENPQITQIAQISFPPSASSAKSADKTPRPPASDFGETSRYDAASCFDAARSAEQLNNKATKKQSFAVLVAWFLGCSKTSGRNAAVQI
jgi:hypothetical protein